MRWFSDAGMGKLNASGVRSKRANKADLALRLSTGLLITIAVALVGIRMIGMFGMVDETMTLSSKNARVDQPLTVTPE